MQPGEAARLEGEARQLAPQQDDGIAIDQDGFEETALLLPGVMELLRLLLMVSHGSHRTGEDLDDSAERRGLQVAHDLLAVEDGVRVGQVAVVERLEVVLLPVGGDGVDDLVEVQVLETGRRQRGQRLPPLPGKENAVELIERDGRRLHRNAIRKGVCG
ncbi:hypothetical protein D9M71_693710 [compost metagenome]